MTTCNEWLVQKLQDEMNGESPSLVRIEQLSAALRDLEVAGAMVSFRSMIDEVKTTVEKMGIMFEGTAKGLTESLGHFMKGSPPPPEILPCAKCGRPSVLERIVDGQAHRVCAECVEG